MIFFVSFGILISCRTLRENNGFYVKFTKSKRFFFVFCLVKDTHASHVDKVGHTSPRKFQALHIINFQHPIHATHAQTSTETLKAVYFSQSKAWQQRITPHILPMQLAASTHVDSFQIMHARLLKEGQYKFFPCKVWENRKKPRQLARVILQTKNTLFLYIQSTGSFPKN
jgi:hypothetical protein